MRRIRAILAAAGLMLASPCARADEITVFAAASMKDALEEAAQEFEAAGADRIAFSFAASSVLARQIEAGAPADAFISADLAWVDWLAERKLIRPETRRVIAGNELLVAAPIGTPPARDPLPLLSSDRFAMGDPVHVPAGRYAQAALENLGIWDRVKGNAVFTENVRVALEFVRRGEVAAAIVYNSDHNTAPELAIAYRFPDGSHPPVVYPAAQTAAGKEAAVSFLDFLSTEAGQAIFVRHGFLPAEQ